MKGSSSFIRSTSRPPAYDSQRLLHLAEAAA